MKRFFAAFALIANLVLIDAVVKEIAARVLKGSAAFPVIPGFFDLAYVENRGCAWGMFQGQVWALSAFGLFALAVLVWKRRAVFGSAFWAPVLLFAGIIGNLIDRIFRGYVIDLFDLHWHEVYHFPCFNVADACICSAAALLILSSLFEKRTAGTRGIAMAVADEWRAVKDIAEAVRARGGRVLLVGGAVRDALFEKRSIESAVIKDCDLECFQIDPEELQQLLARRYQLDLVGRSFGVIKLKGLAIDVAIPRRETKLGLGHRAFATACDPELTLAEAAARRDFTINAIYFDPLTREVIDPCGGQADLEKRILRHVSPHFVEDPLRVLRGMQFAARFELTAAPETIELCRTMTDEGLPRERLLEEWRKLLVKGVRISKGLEFLRATGWTRYYPELDRLIGCEQDPVWHPEGDVWNHTLCCLDAFARDRATRGAGEEEDFIVGLAVLCHDFGKPATSTYDPVKKRIRSLGHDEAGVEPTLAFLRRLTSEERLLKEVPPLVRLHMRPFAMWKDRSGDSAIRRLAAKVTRIDRLIRVASADDAGRPPFPSEPEPLKWLAREAERLRVAAAAPQPIVQGRDLIALGMKPGVEFGAILKAAYEAQLDGAFADLKHGLKFVHTLGLERDAAR